MWKPAPINTYRQGGSHLPLLDAASGFFCIDSHTFAREILPLDFGAHLAQPQFGFSSGVRGPDVPNVTEPPWYALGLPLSDRDGFL